MTALPPKADIAVVESRRAAYDPKQTLAEGALGLRFSVSGVLDSASRRVRTLVDRPQSGERRVPTPLS